MRAMLWLRSLAWLAILVFPLGPSASAGTTQSDQLITPAGDATLGSPFSSRCPQGQVLAGLELRAGDVFDEVQPLCAMPKGYNQISPALEGAPAVGSSGGVAQRIQCPEDHPVVIGASIGAEGVDAPLVDGMLLFCGLATSEPQLRPADPSAGYLTPTQTQLMFRGMTTAPPPAQPEHRDISLAECPPGLAAVGVYGRSSEFIDQLGLICGQASLSPVGIGRAARNAPMSPAQSKERAAEIATAEAAASGVHSGGSAQPPQAPVGDEYLPAAGNPNGGSPFTARCDRGLMLVGVELRAGDVIDQARPVCAEAKTANQVLAAQPYPQAFGGGGGSPQSVYCPPDTPIITGMDLKAEGIDGLVMHEIDLYCGFASTTEPPTNPYPAAKFASPDQVPHNSFLSGADPIPTVYMQPRCPQGLVGVGVYGRAGDYLDQFGLICGPPSVDRGSSSPPPRPPPTIQRGDDLRRAGHMVPPPSSGR